MGMFLTKIWQPSVGDFKLRHIGRIMKACKVLFHVTFKGPYIGYWICQYRPRPRGGSRLRGGIFCVVLASISTL